MHSGLTDIMVASMAATRCGMEPLAGFVAGDGEDASAEQKVLSENYEQIVRAELTRTRWRNATFQTLLTEDENPPLARWDRAFRIPTDVLQVHTVTEDEPRGLPIPYDRYNDYIYCNVGENSSPCLDYTYRLRTEHMPNYLIEVIVLKLMVLLASGVMEDSQAAKDYEEMWTSERLMAMSIDSQQQTARAIRQKRFEADRRTHTRGSYSRADMRR